MIILAVKTKQVLPNQTFHSVPKEDIMHNTVILETTTTEFCNRLLEATWSIGSFTIEDIRRNNASELRGLPIMVQMGSSYETGLAIVPLYKSAIPGDPGREYSRTLKLTWDNEVVTVTVDADKKLLERIQDILSQMRVYINNHTAKQPIEQLRAIGMLH